MPPKRVSKQKTIAELENEVAALKRMSDEMEMKTTVIVENAEILLEKMEETTKENENLKKKNKIMENLIKSMRATIKIEEEGKTLSNLLIASLQLQVENLRKQIELVKSARNQKPQKQKTWVGKGNQSKEFRVVVQNVQLNLGELIEANASHFRNPERESRPEASEEDLDKRVKVFLQELPQIAVKAEEEEVADPQPNFDEFFKSWKEQFVDPDFNQRLLALFREYGAI